MDWYSLCCYHNSVLVSHYLYCKQEGGKEERFEAKKLPANQAGGRRDNDWEMDDDTNEFLEKCGESVEDGKVYRPYQSQASNGI